MSALIISLSIASVLTALFCFRFQLWERPKKLIGYFAFFFALEFLIETYVLPPDVFPMAMAYVCFFLTAIISGMCVLAYRYEKSLRTEKNQWNF